MGWATTFWTTTHDGRKVKIGIPVGITLGQVEDQMHDRYWSKPVDPPATKEPRP